MTLTATDFFCGMGGSSTGLVGAGYAVKVAANHWGVAIDTHAANHPDTEHLCADISNLDLRYLPRTDVLWASPICTELSPAGGRRKRGHDFDLFEDHGHVPTAAFERTRVTFWEVIRAAELFRYKAVLIENVVEAARWELFDMWLGCMTQLGYRHQFVSVSAAHVGDETNPHAPQWRDRLYIVFTLEGVPLPDVEPRPLAWCPTCDENVHAVQWWKRAGRRIGKYGAQYLYVCPNGHADPVVEPYVAPAAAAIDWSDVGVRIGDRESAGMRQLGAATMRRIEHGLRLIGDPALVAAAGNTWDSASGKPNAYVRAWPVDGSPAPAQTTSAQNGIALSDKFVFALNHDGDGRHFDPDRRPLPSRTVKNGEGLVVTEPYVTMLRNHGRATGMGEPLATFSTARHHGLTIPPGAFVMKQYGGRLRDDHAVKPVTYPLPTAVAESAPTLVIPYRKGAKPYPTEAAPLSTVATHDQHGVLAAPSIEVDDCYFRMLKPREAANAQRFDRGYVIKGNQGEQQMQAGNAVAVNVAQWIGAQVAKVLG